MLKSRIMSAPAGDSSDMTAVANGKTQGRRRSDLMDEERLNMAKFLLQHRQGQPRLPRAVIAATADKFQDHRNTVFRIWSCVKTMLDSG
uniref:Transposase n=1 Tax=Peronospora matthiolae TaxID=2874970 RepID=A0AAV1TUK0_9STRA